MSPRAKDEAPDESPLGVAARGAAAGLAAALLLSALSRVLPGLSGQPGAGRHSGPPAAPPAQDDEESRSEGGPPGATPAGALVQPQAPGPEGLAEQFAFKVASGLFGRDLTSAARLAGKAVHLAYGSAWGALYGLLQASYPQPPLAAGPAYGLLVWLVGPGWLVPAMKLMGSPNREPPLRTAMLLTGHLAYGMVVAAAFAALEREGA